MGKWRSPKLWITLASLTLIGVALVQQSAQLRQQSLDSQGWWWLLLGLGLTWLSILINGLAWRVVLGWLGSVPEDLAVVPLFVRSNLLKYLPGGIWHLLERVRLLRPSMGGGPALAGVILDPLLIVAASGLMLMAGGWQNGLVLLAPIPALLLLPRWREPILQRLERSKAAQLQMAGDQPLEIEGSGRSGYPWSPLAAEITFVVCRFSGFFCCVQAFNLAQPAPSQWLAAFGLAYAVGLVVPGAPGGLGVFEATLLVRLGGGVSEAPLLAVVLSYRLISTLADVLAVGSFRADRSIAGWLARRN
jgi:uncharacterized membrane protein YbhN (UPF0104 family)